MKLNGIKKIMIHYIEWGNIFNIPSVNTYAHGCNCAGAMGKGIAVQFKERFPKMYLEYKKLCTGGMFNLGDVFEYNYGQGYVYNLGTQLNWRTKAQTQDIKSAFEKMSFLASNQKIKGIAMPKIGAGLGGANWEDVKNILEDVAVNYHQIEFYVVENYEVE